MRDEFSYPPILVRQSRNVTRRIDDVPEDPATEDERRFEQAGTIRVRRSLLVISRVYQRRLRPIRTTAIFSVTNIIE